MIRLAPFLRASALHVGAAAATVSLREELTKKRLAAPEDVDAAFAVSRVTPGTNLLAMYAVLGHRIGGWPLAVQAVVVGALVPAAIVLCVAVAYTHYESPLVDRIMTGARAGGVAVLLGGAARLLMSQRATEWRGVVLAALALAISWRTDVSLFALLLGASAFGALLLRPRV